MHLLSMLNEKIGAKEAVEKLDDNAQNFETVDSAGPTFCSRFLPVFADHLFLVPLHVAYVTILHSDLETHFQEKVHPPQHKKDEKKGP